MGAALSNVDARFLLQRLEEELGRFGDSGEGRSPAIRMAWVAPPEASGAGTDSPPAAGRAADARPPEVGSGPTGPSDRATSADRSATGMPAHGPARPSCLQARLGFAGLDDRVMSVTVPAEIRDGERRPSASFDVAYDPEHPDQITISLLGLDQDDFIHTVRTTVPFPAEALVQLLVRRKATDQERATWQSEGEDE